MEELSVQDVAVRAALNRYSIFGQSSETECAECVAALKGVAQCEPLLLHGSRVFDLSTLRELGGELCFMVRQCSANAAASASSGGKGAAALSAPSSSAGANGGPWAKSAAMMEAMMLVLANSALTDDLSVHMTLLDLSGPPVSPSAAAEGDDDDEGAYFAACMCAVLKASGSLPDDENAMPTNLIFGALDLIATLSSNSNDLRTAFGKAGILPAILQAMKRRPKNVDILFGGTMTLQTLTMADARNGHRLVEADGLQTLLEITKWCHLQLPKLKAAEAESSARYDPLAASGPPPPGTTTASNSNANSSSSPSLPSAKEMVESTVRHCTHTLSNLMKVPFDSLDKALAKANFGKFGVLIPMDELKWSLLQERKRCQALLQSFRQQEKDKGGKKQSTATQ